MNSGASTLTASFRLRVQTFLADNLPAGWQGVGAMDSTQTTAFSEHWRTVLHANGLLAPSWPTEYGGSGLTPLEQVVLAEEFALAGVPSGIQNDAFSIVMLGNTLLHWGTAEQKDYHLPRILSGEDRWCQGYSEPGAGSDLASLACRAELQGDEWVINGQKIWTSFGHRANWIFLLVRTDAAAPKHKGISLLLVPLDQPGIQIRPIKNMAGDTDFNEVFFTDARCAKENIVGEVNKGWPVAMTLLGYERGESAATLPILFRVELDRLLGLAQQNGADADPVLRDRLADAYVRLEIMRFMGIEALSRYLDDEPPGADAALSKLYWSEYHQLVTELALDILGPDALVVEGREATRLSQFMTDDPGAPVNSSASWISTAMVSRSGTIYAGTSEVQRSIIGEKLLGLPK